MEKWLSDTDLVELLGNGWVEDMSVSGFDEITDTAAMCEEANIWLTATGRPERVTDCRPSIAAPDDELDWLVTFA